MKSHHWYEAVQQSQAKGEAYALVTVLGCTGSTPRDQGSKMVVGLEESFDTIGGGHLEFVVTNKARELLRENENSQQIHHFPLGASLGQCCGGSATVLIETFASCPFNVAVFGAGHVAKELIKILSALPCKVSWIDGRNEMFPESFASNIKMITSDEPWYELSALPAGSDVLILTHEHQLDFDLCVAALEHGNLRHIGLIGSETKAKRFQKRLAHRGFDDAQIAQVICPVGLQEVPGKLPMEVAVSIAGQLIAIENQDKQRSSHRGLAWKQLKQEISGELDNAEQGYRLKI